MKKNIGEFTIILILITLIFLSYSLKPSEEAVNGTLDLTGKSFNNHNTYALSGEWNVYGKGFKNNDTNKERSGIQKIMDAWNYYVMDGYKLSETGYVTYRLHVKTSLDKNSMLGLNFAYVTGISKIMINTRTVYSEKSKKPDLKYATIGSQIAIFNVPSNEFDITIQFSNYSFDNSIFNNVYLGTAGSILKHNSKNQGNELLLIVLYSFLAILNFAAFLMRRELKESLYVGLLLIFCILYLDLVGEKIVFGSMVGSDQITTYWLWYTLAECLCCQIMIYLMHLYHSNVLKVSFIILLVCFLLNQISYHAFLKLYFTSIGILILIIVMITTVSIIITVIGIRKTAPDWRKKNQSLIFIFMVILNFLMFSYDAINEKYIGLASGCFILMYALLTIKKYYQLYDDMVESEMLFLSAQIRPHFLFNTLNSFISMSRSNTELAIEQLRNLTNYLQGSCTFYDYYNLVPLKKELELTSSYIAIEKNRLGSMLDVVFDVDADLDFKVPSMIMQPLVENAIIHGLWESQVGGKVIVSIKSVNKALQFQITDTGIGMDQEKIKELIQGERKRGVGFSNIDKRLRKLYNRGLTVKSKPYHGTQISWEIPGRRKWSGSKIKKQTIASNTTVNIGEV